MSSLKKIRLIADLNSNNLNLLLIWFILLFIPYLAINYVSEAIISNTNSNHLIKTKQMMIDEYNDFSAKLNSLEYINHKMSSFIGTESFNSNINSTELVKKINKHTNTKTSALFYYNIEKDLLEVYIEDDIKNDLGMYSNRAIRNLMRIFAGKVEDQQSIDRNTSYLNKLLSAAGGVNIKFGNSIPILSGKEKLGRLIGYLNSYDFSNSHNNNYLIFCLFKEKNIPLKDIIKTASIPLNKNIERKVITLNNSDIVQNASSKDKSVIMPQIDNFLFSFTKDSEGLSLIGQISQQMLLRLVTNTTYYPYNLDRIKENRPYLKITALNNSLVHPIKNIVDKAKFPIGLLVFVGSFLLIKVSLHGYTSNTKIATKVIICIFIAVIIPYTVFLVSALYNHYLFEENSIEEITQFTQLQVDTIEKAIKLYIGNRELSITELRNKLYKEKNEQTDTILTEWLQNNGANIISYNNKNDKIKLIKANEKETLSALGQDVKNIGNISISNSLLEFNLADIKEFSGLEKLYGLQPSKIGHALVDIGKLHTVVVDEPNSLFAMFPLFEHEQEKDKLCGSVLIRYENTNIITTVKKHNEELFKDKKLGNYEIKNAIISFNAIGERDKTIKSPGFDISIVEPIIKSVLKQKSKKSIISSGYIITAAYLSNVNSIVVSYGHTSENSKSWLNIDYIIIYGILFVIFLSILLSRFIVAPLRQLQKASEFIASSNFNNKIDCNTNDEFQILSETFNEMTDALAHKEKMESYVSQNVLEEVSNNNEFQMQPGGERIPVSVIFCALHGKKKLSQYKPEEIRKVISTLIDTVDEIATSFDGQIDKLIEDTLMVVFRKKMPDDNIAINACKTALAINKKLKSELPDFSIDMGIAYGEAVSGKIGSRNGKLDYTVIGNPVNLAARFKVQAYKAKTTGIIICPQTIRAIKGLGKLKYIERIAIKGRTNRTFPLYELLSLR